MPLIALWLAMAQVALLCGCREAERMEHEALVHNGVSDIWPDSIDLHNGVMLCAEGDTLLQLRVEGNVMRNIQVGRPRHGRFVFRSDFPVFDALFGLEAANDAPARDFRMSPYELWLNPLPAPEAVKELEGRLKNGLVVPAEGRRYGWPVVNENPMWLLAACEAFKAGGNRRWLETVAEVATAVVQEDYRIRYDARSGLFTGIPPYMAGNDAPFPRWMHPSNLFEVQTLGVNGAYWSVLNSMRLLASEMIMKNDNARLPELPVDADSLLHAINREFWMPSDGCYSALVYGGDFNRLQLHSSDNLAQALAILTGMTSEAMTSKIMSKASAGLQGAELFTPRVGSEGIREPVAGAMWCAAAALSHNSAALDVWFGSLLDATATALLRGDRAGVYTCRNALSGFVLRGLLGLQFSFDCLRFAPSVPRGMTGVKRIEGLRYRRSRLSIEIEGTGSELLAFEIDGKPGEPRFPASAEGDHSIRIVLGESEERGDAVGVEVTDAVQLPPPPEVEWSIPRRATVLPGVAAGAVTGGGTGRLPESLSTFVYLDGVLTDELLSHTYELFESRVPVEVQFVSVADNRLEGYSSAPHLYVPPGMQHTVSLTSVAKGGTKVIQDRKIASRFVESDRQRNRNIGFSFNAPVSGEYLVDVHYASGLGMVNRKRRTALRTLWVDGERSGVFVFPQTVSADRDREAPADWQTLTSFSNALRVRMHEGENRIEIKLYQPSPVYVDPTSNSVVADFVRIICLGADDTNGFLTEQQP